MFYFRADANSFIGSGHVMRCLSIATAMKNQGVESTFITADKEAEQLILSYGFSVLCLDSQWDRLEDEIEKILKIIDRNHIKQIMFDTYFVTHHYLNEMKKHVQVIYMDDLNQFQYPVNVLINYNIYAHQFHYENTYVTEDTELLLGCRFAPLRKEFQNITPVIRDKVGNILITTGGSDPENMAEKLLVYLDGISIFSAIKFHVVVGAFHPHKQTLEHYAEKNQNVVLHTKVKKMSQLMLKCDIAISAGGSTLYELCACGIPAISFSLADNQRDGVEEFDRHNLIYYGGDVRDDLNTCLANTAKRLIEMISDKTLREKLSERMQKMVDGFGADRIASLFSRQNRRLDSLRRQENEGYNK